MNRSKPAIALVVEDEPLILMDAVDMFEREGFQVLEAWNADTALELLEREGPIDLLFTDVHMPGRLNGFALARHVHATHPQTAIVICSGHIQPRPDDMPDGAVFLDKPFTTGLVLNTVNKLLGA